MTEISLQRLSGEFAVAPQLTPEAMTQAAASGFRSVINNRPDFEGGPEQPRNVDIERAARAAGLEYVYMPVSPSLLRPEDVARFKQLLTTLPKPALAFCRTGTRSGNLFRAASAT